MKRKLVLVLLSVLLFTAAFSSYGWYDEAKRTARLLKLTQFSVEGWRKAQEKCGK